MPDTLQMRAARANMTIAEWAAAHPDWVGWALHIDRADVRAFLIGAAIGLRDAAFGAPADTPPLVGAQDRTPIAERDQTPIQERRALPLDVAMAQAMALLTGGARAAELAPAYAAKEDGSDAG